MTNISPEGNTIASTTNLRKTLPLQQVVAQRDPGWNPGFNDVDPGLNNTGGPTSRWPDISVARHLGGPAYRWPDISVVRHTGGPAYRWSGIPDDGG